MTYSQDWRLENFWTLQHTTKLSINSVSPSIISSSKVIENKRIKTNFRNYKPFSMMKLNPRPIFREVYSQEKCTKNFAFLRASSKTAARDEISFIFKVILNKVLCLAFANILNTSHANVLNTFHFQDYDHLIWFWHVLSKITIWKHLLFFQISIRNVE